MNEHGTHHTCVNDNATDLPTVCVLCSHNCGIRVDVQNGRIVAVRGDETNPITKGYVKNSSGTVAGTWDAWTGRCGT